MPNNFYMAGGALPPETPSYVERPADNELFNALLSGQFCTVLADHHMGKSSLMFRTAWRLQQQGVKTASFDLTGINPDLNPERAFLVLVKRLNFELKLAIDPDTWWQAHASLEAGQRFTTFLHQVVLAKVEQPLVIFLDGVDRANLNIKFFTKLSTVIQTIYGKRVVEPIFNKLSFVMLGMFTFEELLQTGSRALFNSGHNIVLAEFTPKQASPLQQGLLFGTSEQNKMIFDRIYFWTNGHPYLMQKLCLTTASVGNERWSSSQIDTLIEQLFVVQPIDEEPNLQFVQNSIKTSPHPHQLLRFYRQVYHGHTSANNHIEEKELKRIGLIDAGDDKRLQVRNPLYRLIFDPVWIKAATPIRWKPYVTLVSLILVLIVAGTVGFFIRQQQQRANEADLLSQRFETAVNAEQQLVSLAKLLQLPGYRMQAEQLFFEELNAAEQVALFNISEPLAVSEELITVIKAFYASATLHDEQRDALLEAMSRPLNQLQRSPSSGAIELELEINQWLKGRGLYNTDKLYQRAVDSYSVAINVNNRNPALYFDRGLAYAALNRQDQALADFSQVLFLDEGWKPQVQEALIDDPILYLALWNEQGINGDLIALVPTPTNTSTPTATPTETPIPTNTPTTAPPTETPTPTSTATSTPFPTPLPIKPSQPASTPTPTTPTGVITLLHPHLTDEPSYGPTQFEWQWVGSLPSEFGFEVRVWKENNVPKGVHNSVLDNQNGNIEFVGGNTYRLKTDITNAAGINGSGQYLWTVALVRIAPTYEDIRQQADPGQLVYAGPGPSGGGGKDTGDNSGGGGVGIE